MVSIQIMIYVTPFLLNLLQSYSKSSEQIEKLNRRKQLNREENYWTESKLSLFLRCWSMVGDLQTGQNLSIGSGCDYRAIVEHEILHALGFYHEQSRMDRDDYVNIWWDEIIAGGF